jgi:hypothetical protein
MYKSRQSLHSYKPSTLMLALACNVGIPFETETPKVIPTKLRWVAPC